MPWIKALHVPETLSVVAPFGCARTCLCIFPFLWPFMMPEPLPLFAPFGRACSCASGSVGDLPESVHDHAAVSP